MPDVQPFIDRWKASGASERANFQPFIAELCDLLGLPHPDPATDRTAQNDYTFERAVTFDEGDGKTSTGYLDLYRRDCFVMEGKQGSAEAAPTEAEALGGARQRRKTGTARRGTRGWQQAMERAKNHARRYARALPPSHGWPPLLIVVDVGFCFDCYADFSRQGKDLHAVSRRPALPHPARRPRRRGRARAPAPGLDRPGGPRPGPA